MIAATAPGHGNAGFRAGPEWRWLLAIGSLPVLADLHLILHFLNASPIYPYSGLGQGIGHLFPPYPTIDFNVGVLSQAQGRRAALDIFSGIMPWWNFYEGAGAPLAGNMQSSALFPGTLLLALPDGQLYLHVGLQAVSGLFTFLLMRRLGVTAFAAFIAAAVFEFNGTFAWLPTEPIAFLPMLLYAVELQRAQRPGAWRWIAAALALSIYAGFPEMAYIDGLLAALWTLVRLRHAPHPARMLGHITLGVGCGLLLSAPLIIAFVDYLAVGFYSLHANGFIGRQHLHGHFIIGLALPYVFGLIFNARSTQVLVNWCEIGGYAGVGLPALGLVGMLGRRARGLRLAMLLWIVLSIDIAYGLPGAGLLTHGFLLDDTAFFRYFDPAVTMAFAVLAGLALDDLAAPRVRAFYATQIAAAALLAAGLLGAMPYLLTPQRSFWAIPSIGIAILVLCGMTFAARLGPARRRHAIGAIILAEALFNFLLPSFDNPRHPAMQLGGVRFLQAHLGDQRAYAMGPLQPNYGSYFGVAEIDDCDFPIPANWYAFRARALDRYAGPLIFDGHDRQFFLTGAPSAQSELARNFANFEAIGVRYVLASPGDVPAPGLALPRVYSDPVMNIYQLPDPRPYFTAPGCAIAPKSRNQLVTDCAAASTLTRLELFMPGWRAWVNHRHAPVTVTGEIFQRIMLPAGHAVIRFGFLPPYMPLGYAMFAGGLVLLFLPAGKLQG